jgi:hypothetical protein
MLPLHPVLRALLRVMAAPDSALRRALGGYAVTYVRHHLWAAVRLGLAPKGEPYADYRIPADCYRRPADRPINGRPGPRLAWGTFADFVEQTFSYCSHHVALSPGARVAYTGTRWHADGRDFHVVVELADGRRTNPQLWTKTANDQIGGLIDLTANPRTGTLIAAAQEPGYTGPFRIVEFAVSPRGHLSRIRDRCWTPQARGEPEGINLFALRASPGGTRLYALTRETAHRGEDVSQWWDRWTVRALAADSLAEECSWEAPRHANALAVTDVGHLVIISQGEFKAKAWVYAPMEGALHAIVSWEIPEACGGARATYDPDTGRCHYLCMARTVGERIEPILKVWE